MSDDPIRIQARRITHDGQVGALVMGGGMLDLDRVRKDCANGGHSRWHPIRRRRARKAWRQPLQRCSLFVEQFTLPVEYAPLEGQVIMLEGGQLDGGYICSCGLYSTFSLAPGEEWPPCPNCGRSY